MADDIEPSVAIDDTDVDVESLDPELDSELEPAIEVPAPVPMRKLYFCNEDVEYKLTKYKWTGCTNVVLRDSIMTHASELIRQIIRKQGLNQIYPGQEESAFGDLLQTAWVQIERTLYKYRAIPHCRKCFNPDRPHESAVYKPTVRDYHILTFDELLHPGKNIPYDIVPYCRRCNNKFLASPTIEAVQGTFGGSETVCYRGISKVFNMWSQVARTVILAYIKKEGRDKKNSGSYRDRLYGKTRQQSALMARFLTEAAEVCKYNTEYLTILQALEWLSKKDEKPHDGTIGKLVEKSGATRAQVSSFIKILRLRALEFTDSPINRGSDIPKQQERRKASNLDFDDD